MPSYFHFLAVKRKVPVTKVQRPCLQGVSVQNKLWAQVEPGISVFSPGFACIVLQALC